MRFFANFSDVGSILGGQDPPKNCQKLKKSRRNPFWSTFEAHYVFHGCFGRVWGAIWMGFGKVWGGFWEGLGRVGNDFSRKNDQS